jgi:hypothetical protein
VSEKTNARGVSTNHPQQQSLYPGTSTNPWSARQGSSGTIIPSHVDRSHEAPQVVPFPSGTVYAQAIPASIGWNPEQGENMPLVVHLEQGRATKAPGWHRSEEREARSLPCVPSDTPLEAWELELLFVQTLILSGTSQNSFKCLAYAWGQREGFHRRLGTMVCGTTQDSHEITSETESASSSSAAVPHEAVPVSGMPLVEDRNRPGAAATINSEQPNESVTTNRDMLSDDGMSRRKRSPLETLIAALSSQPT